MSLQNKLTTERNERAVLDLAQKPGNDICADCKVRHPRWASHNLGIFICVNCASIHRKIGTHITKVKSLTMDSWTKDQVEIMRSMGNIKSNAIFNPNEIRYPPPPNLEDTERDSELEQYIRSKYEYRRFMDKSALVASKLGPSRSASSVTLRSDPPSVANNSTSSLIAKRSPLPTAPTPPATTTPSRPTTSQNSATGNRSLAQVRSVSHPTLTNPPNQSQPQGVWADLVSLQSSSTSPSLPLQYQQASLSSQPFLAGNNGYAPGMTTNFEANSYQGRQFSNPYGQQQQQQSFFSSSSMSTPFTGSMQFVASEQPQYSYGQQQNYGQQPIASQLQTQSPIPTPAQAPFFQPQPQASIQMQVPQGNGFLTPSPGLQYMSTSAGQVQFMSHSPQPQLQPYPTPSPQPIGMMSGQQAMGGAAPIQYMQSNPVYQGQAMGGAPQQVMQGNFGGPGGGGYTSQVFGQGTGYQGQQWGAM